MVDGSSTDGTIDIIKKYSDRISKFISEKDSGLYDAMNKGIRLTTGDIVGILNADDIYCDVDVIKNVVEEFNQSGADICFGNIYYVKKDDINKITRTWQSCEYKEGLFQKGWHPPHPAFFVKKSIYDKYGVFRTDMRLAADYELMLRFLEKNKVKSVFLDKFLVKMREGGESNFKNLGKVIFGNKESLRAWKVNNLKINPLIFFLKPIRKLSQLFFR